MLFDARELAKLARAGHRSDHATWVEDEDLSFAGDDPPEGVHALVAGAARCTETAGKYSKGTKPEREKPHAQDPVTEPSFPVVTSIAWLFVFAMLGQMGEQHNATEARYAL
jgi:hypothetical protein